MEYTRESVVMMKGKSFNMKVVEDVDYLLGLVKTDDDVPFWAVLWPAALAMSEYFWEEIDFAGQKVLELGAGLGLTGIVAAAKHAEVLQTDFIPEALVIAQENARSNGINNITFVLADWRAFNITETYDWIIGSDILYEPKLYSPLKEILKNNLRPGGTIVIADPGREDARKFISQMENEGYTLNTVTRHVFESGRKVQVELYFLKDKHQEPVR